MSDLAMSTLFLQLLVTFDQAVCCCLEPTLLHAAIGLAMSLVVLAVVERLSANLVLVAWRNCK